MSHQAWWVEILIGSRSEIDKINNVLLVQGMTADLRLQGLSIHPVDTTILNKETMEQIDNSAFGDKLLNVKSVTPFLRHGRALGLFFNDSMKGFALLLKDWDDPSHVYIAEMAIEKESQGKGYGSYFLSETLSYLREIGISSVSLMVDPNNSTALHIYRDKCGFKFVEYREKEYGEGQDRLYMKLNLRESVRGESCE